MLTSNITVMVITQSSFKMNTFGSLPSGPPKSCLLGVLATTEIQGQGQIMPSVYMLNNIYAPYHPLI